MRKLEEILDEILAEKAKKATCCNRCGRKHVKGTACKKPYLSKDNPRHCKNK